MTYIMEVEFIALGALIVSNVTLSLVIIRLHSVLYKLYLGGILTGKFDR